MRRRFLFAPALLAGWLSGSVVQAAAAQAERGWLPRQVGRFAELTSGQRAEAVATLEKIERLLLAVPELAKPDGFEIRLSMGGGTRQVGPDGRALPHSVVEYGLTLYFFAPSKAVAGEGCGCITVVVNQTASGTLRDAQGRSIYIEGARAMAPRGTPAEVAATLWQVPSATQVYGELWDFARDIREGRGERSVVDVWFVGAGELPWLPVSRETFYEASLIELEGADGNKLAEFRAGLEKTPYQQWMAEAEERRSNRELALREAAKYQPAAEVEKLRKTLEDTEREVTERLRASEAGDRDRNQEGLAAANARRDAFRIELGRMTPEERRMPAYIDNALDVGPIATGWRITSNPNPPAWRVLTPNLDFYRARRSPAEVRSIAIQISIGGTGLRPNVRRALLQTFRTLDWPALNQLLEAPR